MFEAVLLETLADDTELVALLSTFEDAPAIFANAAPQKAVFPYITFRIVTGGIDESRALRRISLYIDIWDYAQSAVAVNSAAKLIEGLLDKTQLSNDDLANIRLSLFSDGKVPDSDIRMLHHNMQFDVRASRKQWLSQL